MDDIDPLEVITVLVGFWLWWRMFPHWTAGRPIWPGHVRCEQVFFHLHYLLGEMTISPNAAPRMLITVALPALRFSSGTNKWLEFSPSECSCAGPMQHAWQPVSARV